MKKLKKTMSGLFIVTVVFMLGCLSVPITNKEPDALAGTQWTWKYGNNYIVLVFEKSGEYAMVLDFPDDGEYSENMQRLLSLYGEYEDEELLLEHLPFELDAESGGQIYTGAYFVYGQTVTLDPLSRNYPYVFSDGQLLWDSAPVSFTIDNNSLKIGEFTYHKGLWYENTPGNEVLDE